MGRLSFLFVTLALIATCFGAAPQAAASASQPPARDEADASLIVMSFNIRYGTANDGENAWPKRRQMVIDRIRESKADVVGLQEALKSQIDELLSAMPEYRTVGVGRDDGKSAGEHSAILYRNGRLSLEPSPAVDGTPGSAHGDFWYSDTPEQPGSKSWGNKITRICTWARFRDTKANHVFVLFNTHFDHESQPSREKSAALLKQRIAALHHDQPVIVMGDFNAGEKNAAIVTMLRVEQAVDADSFVCPPLRDSFRVIHPDEKQVGTFNSFKGISDGDKIDYIFVDDRWIVADASIDFTMPDGRCPSDHFPVLATLRLTPAATSDPKP